MREWLVIENSRWYGVFRPEGMERIKGYIPRDVAEKLLGRDMGEAGRYTWFTKEESALMEAHPDWRTSFDDSHDDIRDE